MDNSIRRIRLNTKSVSIPNSLKKLDEEIARQKEGLLKKYDYLDDIPDYQKKIKLYRLSKDWERLGIDHSKFEYSSGSADATVNLINAEYGEDSAKYIFTDDNKGRKGYRIIIKKPSIDEYQNILDKDGNLLPTKLKN